MLAVRSNIAIAFSLVFAVVLWGGNNAGTKWLVATWPPTWTGGTRFLCAGLLLLAGVRWTKFFGERNKVTSAIRARLWWGGGLSLAAYIVVFNYAVRYTSVAHVALYLGAAPVWALLWEGVPKRNLETLRRYGAASLALLGVFLLLWPAMRDTNVNLLGETLGLAASVLWTNYGRQCRVLGGHLSGAEISGHTMWRAGVMLTPIGIAEIASRGIPVTAMHVGIQVYCILAGGVIAFAFWNNALRHWNTSQVLLFNNLIPLSSMTWAHFCLGETVTTTFWLAMALIVAGVMVGTVRTTKESDNKASKR